MNITKEGLDMIESRIRRKRDKRDVTATGFTFKIKPLSVNECWKGRRFKTDAYKDYERTLLNNLPDIVIPKPPFSVEYTFGFSSKASDFDNPIKVLQDILQKRYGFNDKFIKRAVIEVDHVSKGNEYIKFSIKSLCQK